MGLDAELDVTAPGGVAEEWLPREIAGGTWVVCTGDTSEFSVPTATNGGANTNGGPSSPEFDGESRMNLNAISFETLHGMGVSASEATRFVAYRQRRGGSLRSIDDVDSIRGLSKPLRGWLKAYGSV